MYVSGQTVCTGHFTAWGKALVSIEFEAGRVLERALMFWRRASSIVPAKFWTPDIPAYILVIVLTVLLHTDLKIIQTSILIKWDWRFGLDVFDHDRNSWKVPPNMVISIEVL